jgi:signal peptidase II
LENTGAAFGSFTNHRWVFMIFSTVAIIGVTIYLLCLAENNKLLRVSLALIIGGGVGNMIDRVALGYVIDFLDFHAIWQYIFNIADSCVCVGAGLMVVYSVHALLAEMKNADAAKDQDAGDEPGGDV